MTQILMTTKILEDLTKTNTDKSGFFTEQATKSARDFFEKVTGVREVNFQTKRPGKKISRRDQSVK